MRRHTGAGGSCRTQPGWHLAAVGAVLLGSSSAVAEPIQFIHEGFASGSIVADDPFATRMTFGPSSFRIDAIADTDQRAELARFPGADPYGFAIEHASVSLTIDGMGTYQMLVPTRTYVVHGDSDARVGFGLSGMIAPPDLFNGPMLEGLADWDMTTSITGEAPSSGLVFQWDAAQVMTDAGRVLLNFLPSSAWNFEAVVVPSPASSMLIVGGVCCLFPRRRR